MEQAVQQIELQFQRSEADLKFISHRLEADFYDRFGNSKSNPQVLVQRIQKLQDELSTIRSDCEYIMAMKQAMLETCCSTLVANQQKLEFMLQSLHSLGSPEPTIQFTQNTAHLLSNLHMWEEQIASFSGTTNNSNNGDIMSSEELDIKLISTAKLESGTKFGNLISDTPATSTETQNRNEETKETEELNIEGNVTQPSSDIDRDTHYIPMSNDEFVAISSSIRGEIKLKSINQVYKYIWNHFKNNSITKRPQPLTSPELEKATKTPIKTINAIVTILSNVKLITITKRGIILSRNYNK